LIPALSPHPPLDFHPSSLYFVSRLREPKHSFQSHILLQALSILSFLKQIATFYPSSSRQFAQPSRTSYTKCTRRGPAASSRLLLFFLGTHHVRDLQFAELVTFSLQYMAVDILIIVVRLVTESPLDPWVSVDASGNPVATITPFISTVNGVATTISAAPVSLTATTTTSQSDSKPTETSVPSGGGSFQVCHNLDGHFAPMCQPDNGTAIYVGQTYYGRNLIGGLRSNCSNREQLHGTRRISHRRMPQSS
jgi:hypothetical protein